MKSMEKNKKYWNPVIETLPRERIIEIELKLKAVNKPSLYAMREAIHPPKRR